MSEVRRLWIPGPAGRLEASIRVACPARAAAVVAHPHPQHGGTLHNPVVFHAERELHRAGLTTLRFNFRGVGGSEGGFDGGRGESDDVGAAASWLRGLAPNVPLLLVGYSFGSVCSIAHAARDRSVDAVVAVGVPARLYEFPEIAELGRPLAAIQGDRDEFGTIAEVEALLGRARPPGVLYLAPGCEHLFTGRADEAGKRVAEAVEAILAELLRDPRG